MVLLLSLILTGSVQMENELMLAYVVDELARLPHEQQDNGALHLLARRALEQLAGLQQGQQGQSELLAPTHLALFAEPQTNDNEQGVQFAPDQQRQETLQREQHSPGNDPTGDHLRQLFAVLETPRTYSELIPVVQDFLQEINS
jgi:hypothetical protein